MNARSEREGEEGREEGIMDLSSKNKYLLSAYKVPNWVLGTKYSRQQDRQQLWL